ncbi:unnamed protein product [Phytophthora fragariaefolia]|uniref:Unnamed protein product n=1 Tax=Phytophthora fragariaefolia TaxID=1490495 RepID=A0A9W6XL97_9STRA|nr:unnamed protein product [Phytophthora fragariaefolia]
MFSLFITSQKPNKPKRLKSTDRKTAKILCPSIANDIQVELLKATIAEVSIFGGCSNQFIVAMTSLLDMIAVPAQTTLFSEGDHGNAMYVVHSGVLAIIAKSVTVREIRKGSCFGELYVFSQLPCMATVTTTTYAILYKLSRFHCERVLEGYPDCASVIAVHVKAMIKLLNISEDGSNASTSIINPTNTRKLTSRRTSVTAGKTAVVSGPTLVKIPSRRESKVLPSRRESITQKLSKASGGIAPFRRDISQWSKRSARNEWMWDPKLGSSISADTCLSAAQRRVNTDSSLGPKLPTTDEHGPNMGLLFEHRGFWRLVLLRRCIDHQSVVRMWWLLLLLFNLCYCWLLIPVQVTFPLRQRPTWMYQATDTIANVVLLLDLVFSMNLSFMLDSDKVMDPKQSMNKYLKGGFLFDLLCALPYEYLHMEHYGLMRLPRLLRVFHLKKQLQEIEYFIQLNSRRQLLLFIILLIMMFHVVACIYFGISYIEGFDLSENEAWVCPTSLCLHRLNATHLKNCNGTIFDENADRDQLEAITAMEYFRSLYYAVGVLASPGKTVQPTSDRQLVAALIFMLGGFMISAIVVDNVQKRFTSSAFEQKQFFETSTRIQLFLRRQKAPLAIHHRVKSFLDYWWSSHRGAVIRELLADLPRPTKLDLLRSICMPVLQTLALLHGVHSVRDKLEEILVENAEFILYGQGETVYRHGDYVTGIFFLLEGEVCVVKMGGPPSEVPRGGFFGIAALTQKERGEGYTEHVSANRGCILLFVSREQLQAMETTFPSLKNELLALDQRLLNNKLAGLNVNTYQELDNQVEVSSRVFLYKIVSALQHLSSVVYDPDSIFILMWETWVFMVMTTQWVLVIFQACFLLEGKYKDADALMIYLETTFVLDMQTDFGDNLWLPPKRLEFGSHMLQYMASLYWSFGLMSSSGESEYPQTTAQCIFSVVTMITGVFLFAYVIGNFTDIIELTSSESRDFNVKMGAVRQMLDHFNIPPALQERVKTFLLFKRYHTITQEYLLGQCLPPSLLTDIRLVYLKPMIEKVDFLTGMETSITRMLVSQFTQVLVSRGEFVVKYGDNGSDMFFIFTGVVDVLLPSRIANRPKTTFKAVANVLVNRKESGDSAPSQVGPMPNDIDNNWQRNNAQDDLKKVTEISSGSYFGENSLFTDGRRDAYIQAQTSCILYRLSRGSLELVFDRYPKWRQKVLRIANINREQARLEQLSREEQRRGMTTATGKVLTRSDIVNEKAESLKQKRSHSNLQNSNNATCAYLAVSMEVGFGAEWEGWLPSQELIITNPTNPSNEQLSLRLLRGLFFATVAFVKKAYNPEPETASIYAFHIGMSFVGLIAMSYVIGELASLFISYIGLEVNYRKNFIAIELYVARLRLSERLKARTYVFMTSFWSSHAGVNYEDLLAEMPRDIRTACVLHVSKNPLTWFIMKVVTPICYEGCQSIDGFTCSLAERLRFESYPRDEHVVTEGSIVRAMYFVIKGLLNMHSRLLLDRPVGRRSGFCSGSKRAPLSRLALKICDRAYKYLKEQQLPSCSRSDMEEHWGEALLLALQTAQTKPQPGPSSCGNLAEKVTEEISSNTELTVISSFQRDTSSFPDARILEDEPPLPCKSNMGDVTNDEVAPVPKNTDTEFEELSAHLSPMAKALNTAHGCFEAFAPLLHIMLSTDPLEWNASFNTPNGTWQSNAPDSNIKVTYSRRNSPFTARLSASEALISRDGGDEHK